MNDLEFVNMIFNDWEENLCDTDPDRTRCNDMRYLVLALMADTKEGKKLFSR